MTTAMEPKLNVCVETRSQHVLEPSLSRVRVNPAQHCAWLLLLQLDLILALASLHSGSAALCCCCSCASLTGTRSCLTPNLLCLHAILRAAAAGITGAPLSLLILLRSSPGLPLHSADRVISHCILMLCYLLPIHRSLCSPRARQPWCSPPSEC